MTREEAIEVLRRLPIGLMDLSCEQKSDLTEALNIALAALRGPTREQVVLCQDCRYWQGNNVDYQHPECRWKHDETPNKDDYCSFAERLEMSEDD